MRFRRLSLRPYGAVQSQDLVFREDFGLHLVFGTNGAGKSTTLSALRSSLFGMKPGVYAFRAGSSQLRLGAHLVHSDGRAIEYTRRTSPKTPIWNAADDEPLADELLSPFLGGLDGDRFQTLFGLDLEEMVAGGQDLLQGKGEIGRALFGAGLGGKRLATVTKRLEADLSELHTAGPSKARINVLHKEYKALEKERRAVTLLGTSFDNDRRALAQLRGEEDESNAKRKSLRTEAQSLERAARAAETLDVIEVKEEERRALGDLAPLDEQAAARALELGLERDELRRQGGDRAHRTRALQERQIAARSKADPGLLGAAARIDKLYEGLGAYQVAAQEALEARREMDEARGARDKALGQVGGGAGEESLCTQPQEPVGTSSSEGLAAAADEHHSKVQAAETDRDHLAQEVKRSEAKVETAREAILGIESDLGRALRKELLGLAPFSGDLSSLSEMGVPGAETIEAHIEEYRVIEGERRAQAHRLGEVERAADAARAAIDALTSEQHDLPPSLEELIALRERRNVELAAALDDRAEGVTLGRKRALDVERLVQESDGAADRRAADSERAAAHRARALELKRAEADTRAAKEAEEALLRRERALDDARATAWESLGGAPESPEAMADWAFRRRQVLLRAGELRAQVKESLVAAEAAHAERRADLEAARERLADAAAAWQAWAKKHRLDPDAGTGAAQRRLRLLVDVRAADRDLARASQVFEAKSADEAQFKAAVQGLSDELGVRVDEDSLEQALRAENEAAALTEARMKRLVGAKEAAQRAEAELRTIERDLAEEEEAHELHSGRAKEVLDQLVMLARAEPGDGEAAIESLLARAGVSEQARSIATDLARLEKQFAEYAAGRDRDGIRRTLGDEEVGALLERSGELMQEAEAIDQEQSERALRIGKLVGSIEGDGSDAAAILEARMASVEADIEECAEAYVRARVAEVLLAREVARYREETQGPLLARAQELFEVLTLGAYVQLHPSDDARGNEVMVARRPDGTTVHVDGMSTGTRDQLYLALRISSVEHMLENIEPMPFIADDLFVNFDDERTEAALKVLAELSKSTQVIVFSHHQSVVDTALRLTDEGVPVDVVRLQGEAQREASR